MLLLQEEYLSEADINLITLSPYNFLSLMETLSYEVNIQKEYKPYNLNIVGFRNIFGRPNYFEDTIAVYYQEEGEWVWECFEATTRPGFHFLLNPLNEKGTAILVAGQYKDSYMLGLHKKSYEALIQKMPVKVYRDNNKNLMYDLDQRTVEEGFFGINIHKASLGAKLVGPDSAGCQVIKNSKDYQKFISLCRKASGFWGNKFTYTLVEI